MAAYGLRGKSVKPMLASTQQLSTLQERIESNPSAFYDSETSLSDYEFEEEDLMEDPLEMTLEVLNSRNRRTIKRDIKSS